MVNETSTSSGGIGFFGLLGILFIGLKLTGVITWSWWLVLLPLYGGLALLFGIAAVGTVLVGLAALIVALIDVWEESERKKKFEKRNAEVKKDRH